MAWLTLETIGLVVALLILFYHYSTSTFNFWKKRGVKGPRPVPLFGNFRDVYLGIGSINDCYAKAYYDYKDEPLVGLFGGRVPQLLVKDMDLIKDVFIKDFTKFAERTMPPDEEAEPLSVELFSLDAARWKPLRHRLTPVFTSGKLKEMFQYMLKCSDYLVDYVDKLVAQGGPIECREVCAKYTTDVIGTCAFGLEMNALATDDCEFRRMGKKVFDWNWKIYIKEVLREYPSLFRMYQRFVGDSGITEFFTTITRETIKYRIENNISRHDFIDTLVDIKQHPEKVGLKEVDDYYTAAQAFVFFVAGFETSSLTITHALYEVALNSSIQDKVREDIKDALKNTNGEITYEAINEMKYLHAFVQETLRKYPALLFLTRTAVADYTFSGTKVHIPKGTRVFVPLYIMHHDPDIYPNPDVFDPDRFTDHAARTRHPMSYLPFGDGPRNCIGARFATYQIKVAIIRFLLKYKIEASEKTQIPYIRNRRTVNTLEPLHGMHLKVTKLDE